MSSHLVCVHRDLCLVHIPISHKTEWSLKGQTMAGIGEAGDALILTKTEHFLLLIQVIIESSDGDHMRHKAKSSLVIKKATEGMII